MPWPTSSSTSISMKMNDRQGATPSFNPCIPQTTTSAVNYLSWFAPSRQTYRPIRKENVAAMQPGMLRDGLRYLLWQ